MGKTTLKCDQCGGQCDVDPNGRDFYFCNHCGTKCVIKSDIIQHNYTQNTTQHITKHVYGATGKDADEYIAGGEKWARMGNHKKAIEQFQKAIDEDPESGKAWYMYAQSQVFDSTQRFIAFRHAYHLADDKGIQQAILEEWVDDVIEGDVAGNIELLGDLTKLCNKEQIARINQAVQSVTATRKEGTMVWARWDDDDPYFYPGRLGPSNNTHAVVKFLDGGEANVSFSDIHNFDNHPPIKTYYCNYNYDDEFLAVNIINSNPLTVKYTVDGYVEKVNLVQLRVKF